MLLPLKFHKDFNYDHNAQDNIVLACSIYTQCILLNGRGDLIVFLPEHEQQEVNHVVRTISAGSEKQESYKTRLSDLMVRKKGQC